MMHAYLWETLFRTQRGDPEFSTRALRASQQERAWRPTGRTAARVGALRASREGFGRSRNRTKFCRQHGWETRFRGARFEGAGV